VPPRHIARVALFLAVTVAGFVIARALAERDARRDSDRRAEIAAVQIHGRIDQAASVTESLRRFMLDARSSGVTSNQFASNALRWLGPARFPAAAWIEPVPAARRAAYERRIGQAITTASPRYGVARAGSRSAYLPATLATGFPPMAAAGIDLSGVSGLAAALRRSTRLSGVVATPMASPRTGPRGFFLVAPAPNRVGRALRAGYVAVFVSALGLRAAATGVPAVQVRAAGERAETRDRGDTSAKSFMAAGQRFSVVVPAEPVEGAAAVLPWVILAGGLLVVALGGALGLNAARRARAQEELDRIFTMSQDLIAVADFDGRFTRVNPAAGEILGYTEEELLARPYIDLVHPADRDSTAAQAEAIARGSVATSFENRYRRKDGSFSVLEWTTTPDVAHGLMYAVARDVTARRDAEAQATRLAEEQAALRRVATLVARQTPQAEVFGSIAAEICRLLAVDAAVIVRYEDDRFRVVVASAGPAADMVPIGTREPLGGDENVVSAVFRTRRAARIDDYRSESGRFAARAVESGIRSAVGTPIMVEGRLWGTMLALTRDAPLAPDTEPRIAEFTELMATAIANAEARTELTRLADEQAALRRVATLVAQAAQPAAVFAAVAGEVARLLDASEVSLSRYEGDVLVVVARQGRASHVRVGETGPVGDIARRGDIRSVVDAPVVVEGRAWGVLAAIWSDRAPPPGDTEDRMARFAALLDTAIANAHSREQLIASRARLLAAGDEARHRVVRDLHDGAQQRLVQAILTLKLAQRAAHGDGGRAGALVAEALEAVERGNEELRELAHGILPTVLTSRGLKAAVDAMAKRIGVPAAVDIPGERLPAEIEASAYFIVAEALTNVVKHAEATRAEVRASVRDGMLRVEVRDDGIGGADPHSHGLMGMSDRAAALGGRLEIESPPGAGTTVVATLPVGSPAPS
jgi:PAS domain S-box-containing protein